jgi:DNA-binding winged helix-turn-helix (wHTH) protein/TolB-like protein/Flp pilus assembly protein TadD
MPTYEFGDFTLDTRERRLARGDQRIPLTSKVFETLELLVEAGGRLVDRETFLARLWPDTVVEERNLTVNISTLRKALGGGTPTEYIETIPKVGYRLTVTVRPIAEGAAAPLGAAEPVVTAVMPEAQMPPDPEKWVSMRKWHTATRGAFVVGLVVMALSIGAVSLQQRAGRPQVASAAGSPPRIAVLPFTVAGGSPEDAGLGLGLADAVISRLEGIDGISVRPISAVMPFAAGGDLAAIGKALHVDRIAEGVVQRVGNSAQVSSRIIDVATGETTWNDRFERPYEGFFALQDAVSAAVAGSLMQRVVVERQFARHLRRPGNPDAYRAYLEARVRMTRMNTALSELDAGIEAYQRSAALDPTFAPVWAGLSRAYRVRSFSHARREEFVARAREAAARSLALDATLPEAHVALGLHKYSFEWDWAGAEGDFQRAVDLDPDNEDALSWLGNIQRGLGKHAEAIAHFERARAVNPIGARHIQIHGEALWFAGRIDEAIGMLEQAARLDPSAPTPHWLRAWVLDGARRGEEAIAARQKAAEVAGDKAYLASLHAARPGGYRAVLEQDLRWRTARGDLWDVGTLNALLGNADAAIDALERCVAAFCSNAPILVAEPRLRSLHDQPRFRALAARMNLTSVLAAAR